MLWSRPLRNERNWWSAFDLPRVSSDSVPPVARSGAYRSISTSTQPVNCSRELCLVPFSCGCFNVAKLQPWCRNWGCRPKLLTANPLQHLSRWPPSARLVSGNKAVQPARAFAFFKLCMISFGWQGRPAKQKTLKSRVSDSRAFKAAPPATRPF